MSKHQISKRPRYYLDSCCFIAFLANEAGRGTIIHGLLQDADQGKIEIVTSAISLGEVLKLGTTTAAGDVVTEDIIRDLFEQPFIELVNVDRFVGEEMRNIRRIALRLAKSKFMVGDAIHLTTALLSNVTALFTFDTGDLVVYDKQFDGMRIEVPTWTPPPTQLLLPDTSD